MIASVFADFDSDALDTQTVITNTRVDFGELGGILALTLLFVPGDTDETGGGVAYGNFAFTQDPVAPPAVPLPAALPLLLAGLGAFGLARGRRRA